MALGFCEDIKDDVVHHLRHHFHPRNRTIFRKLVSPDDFSPLDAKVPYGYIACKLHTHIESFHSLASVLEIGYQSANLPIVPPKSVGASAIADGKLCSFLDGVARNGGEKHAFVCSRPCVVTCCCRQACVIETRGMFKYGHGIGRKHVEILR